MDKTSFAVILTVVLLTALFSTLALIFLFARPQLIKEPAFDYHAGMQNASAMSQGSTLLVKFNYANTGHKSLTLERFYIFGPYGGNGTTTSGNPPQQEIPGLVVAFNGTTMKTAENLNFVLQPQDSVFASITIPNYPQYVEGTHVNFNVVGKEIVSGFPGIVISSG